MMKAVISIAHLQRRWGCSSFLHMFLHLGERWFHKCIATQNANAIGMKCLCGQKSETRRAEQIRVWLCTSCKSFLWVWKSETHRLEMDFVPAVVMWDLWNLERIPQQHEPSSFRMHQIVHLSKWRRFATWESERERERDGLSLNDFPFSP